MMSVEEVFDWLITLPKDSGVGIDEGGLCLVVYPMREAGKDPGPYLEIGWMPEEEAS